MLGEDLRLLIVIYESYVYYVNYISDAYDEFFNVDIRYDR